MADDVGMTGNGVVAGTPSYMAPEQARGEAVDQRADLFSLGSVLYASCVGVPPFTGNTALAVLRQVCDHEPVPVRRVNPEVPSWLEAAIVQLLAKDPADRFRSAAEVAGLLESHFAHLDHPESMPAPVRAEPSARCQGTSDSNRASECLKQWRPSLWLPLLILTAALGLSAIALAQPGQGQPSRVEYSHDFREGRFDENQMVYIDDSARYIKREKEGLCISLPPDMPNRPPAGFVWQNRVAGDFEVTLTYEILEAETPRAGKPAELVVFAPFESEEPREWVAMARSVSPGAENEFAAYHGRTHPDGEWKLERKAFAAAAPTGKLLLKRTGSTIAYLAAENGSDELQERHREPCGTGDVLWIRVSAENGGALTAYSVRIPELKVKSGDEAPAGRAERGAQRRWTAIVVAAAILIALGLASWHSVRRFRRGGQTAPLAPPETPSAPPDAGQPLITLTCSGCGKALKVKTAHAGKKGQCPQCGQAVRLPVADEGETGSPPSSVSI
jgi:hypothetical protein